MLRVGETQSLDKEIDWKEEHNIKGLLLGNTLVLRGDHGNKGTEMMKEQTCSENVSSFV